MERNNYKIYDNNNNRKCALLLKIDLFGGPIVDQKHKGAINQ